MVKYIIRRLLLMIPVLFALSMFIFVLIQLPPGTYLDALVAELQSQGREVTGAQINALKARYGLDAPIYVQYWRWVSGFPRGDFGVSFLYWGQRNIEIIKAYLGYTVLLAVSTQLFILAVGIPIGIYSATHKYSLSDHFFTLLGFIGLSIPNFLLALVLMFVAHFVFNVSALGGLFSNEYLDKPWSLGKVLDLLQHQIGRAHV